MEYVVEEEKMVVAEGGKETLISHLSVKKPNKQEDSALDIIENKNRADFETVEEILIDDLVFRKVSSTCGNDTTEIDNVALDNILENIKGLEDENSLLREKLKLEQERFEIESEEKTLIKTKLEDHRKQIAKMKDHICFKKGDEIKKGEKRKRDDSDSQVDDCHGFAGNELGSRLRNKSMLDRIVLEEEEAVTALESVRDQARRRGLLDRIVLEEEEAVTALESVR